jgi:hypothetical protein
VAFDQLILGGIAFDAFSTPSGLPGGGKQAAVVHKLPGGDRVVDLLGPDEADLSWSGEFFGDTALADALLLDAIRSSGAKVPLIGAGQFRNVIITEFVYKIRRLPTWVEYSVTCLVVDNPLLGGLGGIVSDLSSLISSDLSSASGF